MITQEAVLKALSHVDDPDLKKDLVTLGMIEDLEIGQNISFTLVLTTPACPMKDMMVNACKTAIRMMVDPNIEVIVNTTSRVRGSIPVSEVLPGVKHVIAVASGKGGVGKSTLSAALALSLQGMGAKVGLLDADIYGPSVPTIFGVSESPRMYMKGDKQIMIPIEAKGLKLLSIGFMTAPGQPIVWRGPMISSAFKQFVQDTDWGDLDYLIIDLPPGTGDVQLSLVQNVPLTGVVIVTTPQEMALTDARRAMGMFSMEAVNKRILGVVENMSYFTPDDAPDKKYRLFGEGGGQTLSKEYNVPFLGELPLNPALMQHIDQGNITATSPELAPYYPVASALAQQVSMLQITK
jgi:ATP-binding protein involved in chromosome partitioning